ncbi:hypothetical protein SDC9_31879 [bioreactor metagenome]|jgi:hypothetical protein|uniref:GmrSD restriction endonucleases N-terminal domain-containing protein n=1 Tax=bioreactor metagenome TaxID=1076179 RepID=A0A644V3Q8_9ZZZZ|nr:DUF262 domain-containing protein [Lentimicrobium sp.]MEA5110283.1 DUF262 domain-containing protein [Lentimicrobium sp.]
MESFDSTKNSLYEILKAVKTGKIQLPDFQRGWVWDDNRIKGILASIAKSFPIGAIMLLETGNSSVKFKTKPVEGVVLNDGTKPEMLILDGQQRITSLYQAIVSNRVVVTRNDKGYELKRWYYIDMAKALDESLDLEESIISINENKQVTANIGRDIVLDLSKQEYEFDKLMYPVCLVDECDDWYMKYQEYYNYDREKIIFWNTFKNKVLKSFDNYMLPVIVMKKENPKEAVCQVFEKVNTGGVSLTVFELLTATFASEEFDLKEDWLKNRNQLREHKVLFNVNNTDLIQAITLIATYYKKQDAIKTGITGEDIPAVSCKRKEMLNLSLTDYLKYREPIVNGFIKASMILIENHLYSSRDLPYNTQLIPLSAILAVLGDKIDNIGNKRKLMQWFWCGVFGELYGSANETRYALDLPQVTEWILKDGPEPKTIYDANFVPSRLHTLRTRNSAAYKGVYALLMEDDTKDWLSATKIDLLTYYSEAIDIHHIFPVAWCEKAENNIPRKDFDCIINKTPLSGRTNRIISGDAPSKYLSRIQKHAGVDNEDFIKILKSHVLEPVYMQTDDFYGFFNNRKEQILQRIEKAMNKQIPRDLIIEEGILIEEEIEEVTS